MRSLTESERRLLEAAHKARADVLTACFLIGGAVAVSASGLYLAARAVGWLVGV